MLRIHFTSQDLTSVRFACSLDPMWEATLGARALQSRRLPREVRDWQQGARRRFTASMRPLIELVPSTGGFPDFLTPTLAGIGIEEGVTTLLDTPTEQIRAELADLFPEATPWQTRLALGSTRAKRELGQAVRDFHHAALNPLTDDRQRWLSADRARWTRQLAEGGVAAFLASLMPGMRWKPPMLVYQDPGGSSVTDIHLSGRGMSVYPSRFTHEPLILDLPGTRPTLIVRGNAELLDDASPAGLADLVGRTRASVMISLQNPASTTELAARLAISVASASEHARVLRGSGLVATQRMSQSVLHTLTPLGSRLLMQSSAKKRHWP